MRKRRINTIYAVTTVLMLYPVLLPAEEGFTGAPAISISIDHSDGGRQSERQMHRLLEALQGYGCKVVASQAANATPAQLHFDPAPVSHSKLKGGGYRLIARAITTEGKSVVRGAILVHASTDIKELASLKGQRIAFVGKSSPTGYQEPVKLLFNAGVTESWDTVFFVGNHVGAISMLLHSDADVAVAAEPLAERWADYNALSVVAMSDEVETGGWWAHDSLPIESIRSCVKALEALDRSDMKILPAWIGGFNSVESSG